MIVIALAGGIGAVCRASFDGLVRRNFPALPWGTFAVNVVGCFLLGAATSALATSDPGVRRAVTTGFFAGFTTFSTAMLDGVELMRAGRKPAAAAIVLGTLISGLLSFIAGSALGSVL